MKLQLVPKSLLDPAVPTLVTGLGYEVSDKTLAG